MVVEVVEQRLRRHTGAPENERASHEFGIGLHRTVIERQHVGNRKVCELGVNRSARNWSCGMGGSSLAPEVICRAAGVELVVLDSSDPDFVRSALETDLDRTVVVVSSKSGGTVETDSQRRAF